MKSKKIEYIDLANVIATFAVVFLHTNSCFWDFSKERYWLTANIIESIFIFAVPLFFMISSTTLIDYQKRYDTKTYFKKRLARAVIPFAFWTLFALVFDIVVLKTIPISDLSLELLYNGFVNNGFCGYYWFFTPLFIIYACLPLFASIEESKRIRIFKYIFVVGFIFNGTVPFIINAFHLKLVWPVSIYVVSGYSIFTIMGYLIHKIDFTPNQRCIIYVAGLAGLLMHFGGTYFESYALGGVSMIYKELTQAPILMYSGAVFLFIKQIASKVMNTKLAGVVHFVKKYTFSIYLLHFYVIEVFNECFGLVNYKTSIIYRLGMPLVVIPITIILTALIRKLKVGKKVLP